MCRGGSGVFLHANNNNNNNNVVEIFRFHDSPWLYSTTSTSVTAQSTHAKSISNQQPGREWECCVLSSRDTRLTSWVSKPICGDSGAVSLGWGDVKDNGRYQHKNQALLYKSQLGHTKLYSKNKWRNQASIFFLNPNMGLYTEICATGYSTNIRANNKALIKLQLGHIIRICARRFTFRAPCPWKHGKLMEI